MNTKFKAEQTTFRFLLCFFLISVLQFIALISQSWYVLTININRCLNCGPIIITMGALIEHALDEFDSNTETKHVFFDIANRVNNGNNSLNNNDEINGETDHIKDNDIDTLYKIENETHLYGGLWRASLCTQDGVYCALVDTSYTDEVFSSLPLLRKVRETIAVARLLFLVSMVIVTLTTTFGIFDVLLLRSNASMTLLIGGMCSVFVSLIGVVTASLPFYNVTDLSDVITVHPPWSLISTLLIDYVLLATVFRLWRQRRDLFKYSITVVLKAIQNRLTLRIKGNN